MPAQFGAKFGLRLEDLDVLVVRVQPWPTGLPGSDSDQPALEVGVVYDDRCWQQRIRVHALLVEAERFFADRFTLLWHADTISADDVDRSKPDAPAT